MSFTIQSDVPKPKPSAAVGTRRRKYPLDVLDVGQFFFVPNRETNNLSTHVSTTGRQLGRKFSTRMVHMVRESRDPDVWRPCAPTTRGAVLGIGVWRDE